MNFIYSNSETKFKLFSTLIRKQSISRSDLAQILNLTRASVSNIVSELKKKNLIIESDKISGGVGRKKILLEVNSDALYVIGIEFERKSFTAGIYNLSGKLLKHLKHKFYQIQSIEDILKDVENSVVSLLSWAQKKNINVSAIGIGIPGPVDPEEGVIYNVPYFLDNKKYGLKLEFEKRFGIPTFIEKDANAAALGEFWYGIGRNYNSFVYLLMVEGIGAGLILNQSIYRGINGLAGKVGKFLFLNENKKATPFEKYGGELSILNLICHYSHKSPFYSKILKERDIKISDFIDGVKRKDTISLKVLNEIEYYIALIISNIIYLLDPNLIIIGGDLINVKDDFSKDIEKLTKNIIKDHPMPEIKKSGIYNMSISLGGATRAFMEIISTLLK
ncbi:Sugar kinase of the NBD/HSP70 family, may contain an N-terminal HTH domain [Marinitoga hydrogenitolerans DSM 16785]|uniref:Sugar kinase of the NBD/HSP70 family, may contain an N-terminal HTH domain n=1 Tax=Marinitoga hydrogenitolerans (strain DSM 16785 / JCM 12826 / AT1271) TaxID=1122195 RepID=A0A1M4SKV9_MARH1|nr:ROK family transcriptional regulator [Marinitoga hydrogenitolerans]SHE32846.1 Sugar kinase of the NBD/HSP70 family, may contain an N-terminal HTH domain [Marinitoga hydrogenitolerans DSM 16785]